VFVDVGGLISYGANLLDASWQMGNFTRAASLHIANIEECIRNRYWAEAIDDAEGMKVIMDRLIEEMQKGV
jgi:hypothetical protein